MIYIDGLECERAIKRLDNNLPLYLDLIEKYINGQQGVVGVIRQQTALGNKSSAIRRAHSLKGLSATLGAVNIEQLSAQLECSIEQSSGKLAPLLNQLEAELDNTISHLVQALDDHQDLRKSAANKLESIDDVPVALERVAMLLEDSDTEAIELLEGLVIQEGLAELQTVLDLARNYRFDEALESFTGIRTMN